MRCFPSRSRRRSAAPRLGVLAVGLIGAIGFAGCSSDDNVDLDRGRALFLTNCGTCHTLAQAGSSAQVGPNLDAAFAQARADGMTDSTIKGVVHTQIESPRYIEKDAQDYSRVYMPPEIVTGQDATDVASYVGSVAGVPGAQPPQLAAQDLFAQKCGICHTLAAAGTNASTGPNLDQVLVGKDAKFIETSIVDPSAEIAQGYQDGIMPQDFSQTLTPKDLQGLVDYLVKNVKGTKQ